MSIYTTEELLEAKCSIASTLSKCEKAVLKLTPGIPAHADDSPHSGISNYLGVNRSGAERRRTRNH